jgi:hypothetical protein
MKTVHIFEFGGKGRLFVSGLFWQPLPGMAPAARKAEIEKIAKEQKFDLMVIRSSDTPQVGFCSTKESGKPGLLSAAAMISKTVDVEGGDRNLLCATEISNDQWLYVAQRGGVILPDGDQVGTQDQIRARMLEDLSTSDWGLIYAPSHWGVSKSKERKFEDFFPKKGTKLEFKKWWAIRPVKSSIKDLKAYLPVALIAVLLVGGISGYMYWKKLKDERELAEFVAQQAALDAANANKVHRLAHPWKTLPRATAFGKSCDDALRKVNHLFVGNWSLSAMNCNSGILAITWKRQENGTIAQFREIEPRVIISDNGNTASLTVPVIMTDGVDEKAPVQQQREDHLYNQSQMHTLGLTITEAPAPPTLPGQAPPPQAIKDWKEFVVSVKDTTIPPTTLIHLLDGDGYRISSIQTEVKEDGVMSWNLEGVQYVQP